MIATRTRERVDKRIDGNDGPGRRVGAGDCRGPRQPLDSLGVARILVGVVREDVACGFRADEVACGVRRRSAVEGLLRRVVVCRRHWGVVRALDSDRDGGRRLQPGAVGHLVSELVRQRVGRRTQRLHGGGAVAHGIRERAVSALGQRAVQAGHRGSVGRGRSRRDGRRCA